ncbi:MAG TPA: DUF4058 family protein [Gemmataceae bacterium]|nr:DUF4058 family protein [Gemmataceae bacterium]
MPSPFPGMDPYLEDPWLWPDFHLTFVIGLRAELNRRLPVGYVALADRYVWVQEPETEERKRLGKPDVFLTGEGEAKGTPTSTAIVAPVEVVLPSVTEKGSPYLKIMDRKHRRLVTVIELLSPANKTPGKDRDAYLMKQYEYLATDVNLVEMDLLRKGERLSWATASTVSSAYYVLVSRAVDRPRGHVWPFSVRDPLPTIAVPLTERDGDLPVELGMCMNQVYDTAGYARELDYTQPPNPPLDEPDAVWARQLLATRTSQGN